MTRRFSTWLVLAGVLTGAAHAAPAGPVAAPAPQPIIAASNQHVCTLFDGSVKCWGHVGHGRLGYEPAQRNPSTDSRTTRTSHYFTSTFYQSDTDTTSFRSSYFASPEYYSLAFVDTTRDDSSTDDDTTDDNDSTDSQDDQRDSACPLPFNDDGHIAALANRTDTCTQDATYMPPLRFQPQLGSVIGIATTHNTQAASCALFDSGSVVCWGGLPGLPQQLGVPNATTSHPNVMGRDASSFVPVDFGAGVKAEHIAMGFDHACVIRDYGKVQCWGSNFHGQLGYAGVDAVERCHGYAWPSSTDTDWGTTDSASTACMSLADAGHVPLFESTQHAGAAVVQVGLGRYFTCALTDTGAVGCWGAERLQIGYRFPGRKRGRVFAYPLAAPWTGRRPRSIGRREGDLQNLTAVTFGNGSVLIAQLAVGDVHTCALDTEGGVYCWGYLQYLAFKHLDDGSWQDAQPIVTTDDDPPNNSTDSDSDTDTGTDTDASIDSSSGSDALHIGVYRSVPYGDDDAIAERNYPRFRAWPAGAGPTAVDTNGHTVVRIWSNMMSTCAQLDTGDIRCWGDWARRFLSRSQGPKYGTLGGRPVHEAPFVPFAPSLRPLLQNQNTQLVTGAYFACAAFEVGTVQCWGLNRACVLGQVGSSPCDSVHFVSGDTNLTDASVLRLALPTPSPSVTPSVSPSPSETPSVSPSVSGTPRVSPSVSSTMTASPSVSVTPTSSAPPSPSSTSSASPSPLEAGLRGGDAPPAAANDGNALSASGAAAATGIAVAAVLVVSLVGALAYFSGALGAKGAAAAGGGGGAKMARAVPASQAAAAAAV